MAALITPNSFSTVSTFFADTTTYEIVDAFGSAPGGQEIFISREWWSIAPTSTSTHPMTTAVSMPATAITESAGATKLLPMSGGAIAGLSIATALAGLLLGILAGYLHARRGKKQEPPPEFIPYSDREKDPTINNNSTTTADGRPLDLVLLASKSDAVIASDLRALGRLVQKHVKTHYHLQPVELESRQLRQPLHDLGIERGSAPAIARLASLALEPRTRHKAISYVISKAIFESTVIGGSTCISLLPPVVSGFSANTPPSEDHLENGEDTELAMSRWRALSAYLLHPNRSQRTPLEPSEDVSTREAQKLTVALNGFLEPFVSEEREERYEQENDLREVIADCALFGYVIFSQPAEYRFRFDGGGGAADSIVVFPGLYKIIDEDGNRYQSPLPQVVEPVVEAV